MAISIDGFVGFIHAAPFSRFSPEKNVFTWSVVLVLWPPQVDAPEQEQKTSTGRNIEVRIKIMSALQDVLAKCEELDTRSLLRYLIQERFPGKVAATVSLRARSVAVLQMISEIEPATPVFFCHPKNIFPESLEYRATIVDELGLTDVREPVPDTGAAAGTAYLSEALWSEDPVDHTRRYTTIALNQTLSGFDCWISAVYHIPYSDQPAPAATEEGHLVRVNPLATWSKDRVRTHLAEHGLAFHPKAMMRVHETVREEPAPNFDQHHY